MNTELMDAQGLLEQRLDEMTPALPTQWPNASFTRPASGGWQRVDHLALSVSGVTIAGQKWNERGSMQVLLCFPENTGRRALFERAQLIRAQFPVGWSASVNSTRVLIVRPVAIGSAYSGDGWAQLPLTIGYLAEANL